MRLLLCLIYLGTCTCLFAQKDPALQKRYATVRKLFDEKQAMQTVGFVEKYWRIAGNTGFNESIFRVESILQQAGYVEASKAQANDILTYRIEKRPMKKPTWEPVDAVVEMVGESEPLLTYQTNRNMLAINSASTPEGGIEATVAYLPALSKEALSGLSLKGKILFAENGIGAVYRAAMEAGAVGAIGYSLPSYTQPVKHVNSIQFSSIQQLANQAEGFGILLSTKAKDRLKAALAKGEVRLKVRIQTKRYTSTELTLVADVTGKTVPTERFVFSAHVQEPGANDNATGVGTLAEMARVTAEMIRNKTFVPQRSISFLWGDEIVSTGRYVKEDTARARGIHWGMSLDMVGEDVSKTGGSFLIEKMPDPSAVWTRGDEKHSEWGGSPLPESAIVPHYFNDFILNRCLDQASTNGWVVKTNPFEGGSDHTPFLQAGIPGLLLWHFTDEYYHTDGDRLDKVSALEMKNVGVSALVAAMSLTDPNEATTLYFIEEAKQTALRRLDTEFALSVAAIRNGAAKKAEQHILEVWAQFYIAAIGKMTDMSIANDGKKMHETILLAQKTIKECKERLIGTF